jgi:hypothetical protein
MLTPALMIRALIPAVVCVAATVALCHSLATGRSMSSSWRTHSRGDQPFAYWIDVIALTVFAVMAGAVAAWMVSAHA